MKRRYRNVSTLIGLAVFTLVIVISPCQAQYRWEGTLWEPYIHYSNPYNAGRYGRTASFSYNDAYKTTPYGYDGVLARVDTGMLTAWVELDDVEDSVSASAYSYTLGGMTWEWTGAPGTAPAATVVHDSYVHGEVWAVGVTSDEAIYPYPSLSVEAEAEGVSRVVSGEYDKSISGYATGYVYGPRNQSHAYFSYVGTPDPQYYPNPNYVDYVSGANGNFEYDVEYWLSWHDGYETASGLSEIDGIAGVLLYASCSGSASNTGDNEIYVAGEGGVWHGFSYAQVYVE